MMRPAKIVAIVVGAIVVLIGLCLIAPGGFLLGAYGTLRDSSGFFETSSRVVSTGGYALSTPDVDLNIGPGFGWIPRGSIAAVRMRAASSNGTSLFVGIGPSDKVGEYLNGVGHDEVTNFGWMSASVTYRHFDGGAPSSPPGQQAFWVAKQEGSGSQVLEWNIESGNWTAVIMNSDATAAVTANASVGARFDILLPIAIALTVVGVILLVVGIVLIVIGARRSHRSPQEPRQQAASGPPQQAAPGSQQSQQASPGPPQQAAPGPPPQS
jgi:uncharacterized membrane protein